MSKEEIKQEKTSIPLSQRFLTGKPYVSPKRAERNYFLTDDSNQALEFKLSSYRKVQTTPTDLQTGILGLPSKEPTDLESIPLGFNIDFLPLI